MAARVLSVNLASSPDPNPAKDVGGTGIGKRPVDRAVLRAPGPKLGGLGSGLVGDVICDVRHHGGDRQAVYAYAREELDAWEARLGRELPNGMFGENLTTADLDVDGALVGERWGRRRRGWSWRCAGTGPLRDVRAPDGRARLAQEVHRGR